MRVEIRGVVATYCPDFGPRARRTFISSDRPTDLSCYNPTNPVSAEQGHDVTERETSLTSKLSHFHKEGGKHA